MILQSLPSPSPTTEPFSFLSSNFPLFKALRSSFIGSSSEKDSSSAQSASASKSVPPGMLTIEVFNAKCNLRKNRYSDVKCIDQSRVVLPKLSGADAEMAGPGSDYIHANFVDGYYSKRAYIGAQGIAFHSDYIISFS